MNAVDIAIAPLLPEHAEELSLLFLGDPEEYRSYFTPFSFQTSDLSERLANAQRDRYWALRRGGKLAGFFMLRGFDEGYERPSFGVYIGKSYAGSGLAQLALQHALAWCRSNNISALMLKSHPDNAAALSVYTAAGFTQFGTDPKTGQLMFEKRFSNS